MPKSRIKITNQHVSLTGAEIAKALAAVRPRNLFSNNEARLQWYGVVSRFAEDLRDADGSFSPNAFFDVCGVPN
jgi:hypothetical protein